MGLYERSVGGWGVGVVEIMHFAGPVYNKGGSGPIKCLLLQSVQ